jgi:hypothetical protein
MGCHDMMAQSVNGSGPPPFAAHVALGPVLASDAEARGLRNHHLVELVRMSLGCAAQA